MTRRQKIALVQAMYNIAICVPLSWGLRRLGYDGWWFPLPYFLFLFVNLYQQFFLMWSRPSSLVNSAKYVDCVREVEAIRYPLP